VLPQRFFWDRRDAYTITLAADLASVNLSPASLQMVANPAQPKVAARDCLVNWLVHPAGETGFSQIGTVGTIMATSLVVPELAASIADHTHMAAGTLMVGFTQRTWPTRTIRSVHHAIS